MNDQLDVLQIDRTDPTVPVLTLNRPERLNALNMDLIAQLHTAFASMDDDPSVRAVILTGSGRAFSAGLDIKEPGSVTDGAPIDRGAVPATFQIQEHIASLHERIHRLRKPVIAAVNGVAVGGGFSLALAADLRIAIWE